MVCHTLRELSDHLDNEILDNDLEAVSLPLGELDQKWCNIETMNDFETKTCALNES